MIKIFYNNKIVSFEKLLVISIFSKFSILFFYFNIKVLQYIKCIIKNKK